MTAIKKMIKNKKGFSLVELLAVVAILSVFIVVLVPSFINHIGESKNCVGWNTLFCPHN